MLSDNLEKVENRNSDMYVFTSMLKHIGYSPATYPGDKRDNNHRGNMTKDANYLAFYHMIEHNLADDLNTIQRLAVLDYISDRISRKQKRYSGKGQNFGLSANVDSGKLAREFHCKFDTHWKFAGTHPSNGSVAFWELGLRIDTLHYVTATGEVFSYLSRPSNLQS